MWYLIVCCAPFLEGTTVVGSALFVLFVVPPYEATEAMGRLHRIIELNSTSSNQRVASKVSVILLYLFETTGFQRSIYS